MDVDAFIHHLTTLNDYNNQILHIQHIPPQNPEYGVLAEPLHKKIRASLEKRGIIKLFKHQAEAINYIRIGYNIIISTQSASGKSLCYNIPVLESIIKNSSTRALYLFPTKALAQDQLRKLQEIATPDILKSDDFATYDGDTPQSERVHIKKYSKIILSNPDMLHFGILPYHKLWSNFFSSLRFIVIDEAHIYRGVFGSHVANILRRLRRICSHYNSNPQFILSSATIGNPLEHAEKLVGLPFKLIDKDGAPHGKKIFLFWNPPIIDTEMSLRRSINSEATLIFSELVKQEFRSIVFARSRKLTELIYMYTRDHLNSHLSTKIKPYRAGYIAEDRRQIEKGLFEGKLTGVVATNALELGIDIGDLEATVLTGYPGTISSTWQQAGRSGRSNSSSLSILIADNNPLDQYLINNPDFFFGHPFENVLINWQNPNILKLHLLCAAWEKPIHQQELELFGESAEILLYELENENKIRHRNDMWYISPKFANPFMRINIRCASEDNYAVLDISHNYQIIETVSESNAFFQLHDGAIYLHQGETYFIKKLDTEKKIALAEPTSVPYYTQAKDITDVSILKEIKKLNRGELDISFGEVRVTTQVLGFRKKMQFTEEIIGDELLELPPLEFITQSVWFNIPDNIAEIVHENGLDFAGGLHALEHANISLLPLFAMCDRNDIGGVSTPVHHDTGKAQIFIYDAYPGGIGISEKGFEIIPELLKMTNKHIYECPCQNGCPACIQSPKCGNNNEPLDKKAAIIISTELLDYLKFRNNSLIIK